MGPMTYEEELKLTLERIKKISSDAVEREKKNTADAKRELADQKRKHTADLHEANSKISKLEQALEEEKGLNARDSIFGEHVRLLFLKTYVEQSAKKRLSMGDTSQEYLSPQNVTYCVGENPSLAASGASLGITVLEPPMEEASVQSSSPLDFRPMYDFFKSDKGTSRTVTQKNPALGQLLKWDGKSKITENQKNIYRYVHAVIKNDAIKESFHRNLAMREGKNPVGTRRSNTPYPFPAPSSSSPDDDLTVKIGDKQIAVSAHWLMSVSPVISRMLSVEMKAKQQRIITLDELGVDMDQFKQFLEAITYLNGPFLPNPKNVVMLLKLADYFQVRPLGPVNKKVTALKSRCELHLINCVEIPLIDRFLLIDRYGLDHFKNSFFHLDVNKLRAFFAANHELFLPIISKEFFVRFVCPSIGRALINLILAFHKCFFCTKFLHFQWENCCCLFVVD